MKILNITTVGITQGFFTELFKELTADGHTVELACNELEWDLPEKIKALELSFHHIDCSRSPFASGNAKAIGQIRNLVTAGHYDIVHCHTPIAAALTRMACRKLRRDGLRVIYTAHGFHFYKGAPAKNWILYYPIEKMCSKWTDVLITINREDFELAKSKFAGRGRRADGQGCRVEYIPGVGIDTEKYANTVVDRAAKRAELGIPEDAFMLLSVGELNENKNHQLVIRAMAGMDENIHYAIAGKGDEKDKLEALAAELGIGDRLHLLGYRSDVAELYKTADALIHPSIREGLPVTVMEALAAGLPVLASKIRGNADLVSEDALFAPLGDRAEAECRSAIAKALAGEITAGDASGYDKQVINEKMRGIYGLK